MDSGAGMAGGAAADDRLLGAGGFVSAGAARGCGAGAAHAGRWPRRTGGSTATGVCTGIDVCTGVDAGGSRANVPVPGRIYSDRLPFGSQSVPLPPGHWLAVAVGNNPPNSGVPSSSAFLVLVLGDQVAAAALISGSTAAEPQAAGFLVPADVQFPAFYYRRVLMAVDHGLADFWLCGGSLPSKWSDPVRRAAITALAQQHVGVADRFDSGCVPLVRQAELAGRGVHVSRACGRSDGGSVDGGSGSTGCSGASAHRKGATLGQGVARCAASRLRGRRRPWRKCAHTIALMLHAALRGIVWYFR